MGCSPWGRKESGTAEQLTLAYMQTRRACLGWKQHRIESTTGAFTPFVSAV